MSKIDDKKIWRTIDANFNRAKEAARVCEDVCRFIRDDSANTRAYKRIRHELTAAVEALDVKKLIKERNIEGDIGVRSQVSELKREDVDDILYANSQRLKESLRVLEEFVKLIDTRTAERLKKLRYQTYAVETKIVGR